MVFKINKEVNINPRVSALKLKAAQKYNISPESCHIGHVLLQGMYEYPHDLNQIDAATDKTETNISVAIRSSRLANAMHKCGLKLRDTVIIMAPNHLDLAVAFYACQYNGYSLCAMDPSMTASDLVNLFFYIKPCMVFCQKSCDENVKEAYKSNNLNGQIVTFDDPNNDLESFISKHNGTEINFRPAEFDHAKVIALLMLTSGTTGLPKVAKIPFNTLLNAICNWWTPFTAKLERVMILTTVQFLSSMLFISSGPLRGFARVQSSVPLTPPLLVALINKYRPNVTAWSPYLLSQFIDAAGHACDFSSFIYIVIGGSAIEKSLVDKLRKKCNAFLYLVYGMTELLAPVFDFDSNTPFGSTGVASEKYKFRIMDEGGQVLDAPYESGELWIKGDAFFTGYMNNPDETSKILTDDGWFKTGDIFYKDDQGYYYFVERKRLMIKHFGFQISPLQLEEVIKRHPGVLEVCVVGIPDPKCLELPIAAILKKKGQHVEPQEIFDLLKDALPDRKQLKGGLFFVDTMPETPSGKLHRSKIKEMALTVPKILPK